jgi:hypothetical protein
MKIKVYFYIDNNTRMFYDSFTLIMRLMVVTEPGQASGRS